MTLLTDIGTALYGSAWKSEMARALGVSVRTVRRWAAGETEPPQGVLTDAKQLVTDRIEELQTVFNRIAAT